MPMCRTARFCAILCLSLASLLPLRTATAFTAEITSGNGSVIAEGWPASIPFAVSPGSLTYQDVTWHGETALTWSFTDLAMPGALSSPVTLQSPPLSEPPFQATVLMPGATFVSGAGSVPPIFFTGLTDLTAVMLTPFGSTQTRLNGASSGLVAEGGTYQLTFLGLLDSADGSFVVNSTLRLFDVDPAIYGDTTLRISTIYQGTFTPVPEPHEYGFLVALTLGLVVLARRSRGQAKAWG